MEEIEVRQYPASTMPDSRTQTTTTGFQGNQDDHSATSHGGPSSRLRTRGQKLASHMFLILPVFPPICQRSLSARIPVGPPSVNGFVGQSTFFGLLGQISTSLSSYGLGGGMMMRPRSPT
jgi:hypothetical protein